MHSKRPDVTEVAITAALELPYFAVIDWLTQLPTVLGGHLHGFDLPTKH